MIKPFRRGLHDLSREERLRLFWQGKRKKTRFCVELWLKGGITQHEIHMKYGFAPRDMQPILRALRDAGLVKDGSATKRMNGVRIK